MAKIGGGGGAGEREVVSQFSVRSFPLTVAAKIVEENFSVSLVSGSEFFLLRMLLSKFSVRDFCLTVPKTSVEESFFVSEVFWYRQKLGIREGEAITSFRHFFCLAVPNLFVEEPCCVPQNIG